MHLSRHVALLIALSVASLLAAPALAAWKLAPAKPVQPVLTTLVTPRAAEVSSVGINRIVARTGEQGRDIQVMTAQGPIYFAWPANVTPVEFVIDVSEGGALTVRAEGYTDGNNARYAAALEAILSEAVRQVESNNVWATRPRP